MKIIKGSRGCVFCKQSSLDELDFGELKVTKTLRAHYYCLLFSETITQSGRDDQGILGFLPTDILSELSRSKKKQCQYCKKLGASAGCANKFCNTKFHLNCALEHKTQQDFNSFNTYCHKHRKGSNVPARMRRVISDYQCVICLENFNAKIDVKTVIWADCCKAEILLHLKCMKKLALSAGYFTKCPGCNNKTDFITTIKLRGVFVPERDASWELTSNAYSELYYVHETCDATKCLCPHGRKFSLERGKWKKFLCKLCGSSGTHQFCTKVQKEYICNDCNLINDNSNNLNDGETSTSNTTSNTCDSVEVDNSTDNCNDSTKCTTTHTSSPSRHKTVNETEEDDDYINVETIDPLDDVIVVDCFDEDSSIANNLNKTANLLNRISNEVTVKTGTAINKPTTSKAETKIPITSTVRRVATKSTTKLPYLKEKHNVFKKEIDSGENLTRENDTNSPQSSSITEISKHSHSHKERRIATKSTTKLPFIKKECSDLENTRKLEKQTINSLDDLDDVIVIDSDEDDSDCKESTEINSKTVRETCHTPIENILNSACSSSPIERKVALKSTTKLPPLKRKNSNDENVPLDQYERLGCGSSSMNKIMKYSDTVSHSKQIPGKKCKRLVARMSTTQKSTSRLCNLIKKVHTVIGNQSICDRNNFPFERDPLADVMLPTDKIETIYSDENQLHYSIPLNVDSEIEFVNCPKFSVSGQENPCQKQ